MNLNKNNIYSVLILVAGILYCYSHSNRVWAKKSVELQDSSSSLTPLFVYNSQGMTSFTPWANHLELSSRYVSTMRAQNLSKQMAEERIKKQQLSLDQLDILDDFDRYILAAAVNPKHESNPLFDSWLRNTFFRFAWFVIFKYLVFIYNFETYSFSCTPFFD